ncbi:alpha/beta fold hydrolase [Nonomuraea sp. NPDC059007]|uniref:alpha/beta fold hydrolase n=1 Tax=Nonomuraea sp. NPDC059007 TaxID=3346692 RepID=UPI00367A5C1A
MLLHTLLSLGLLGLSFTGISALGPATGSATATATASVPDSAGVGPSSGPAWKPCGPGGLECAQVKVHVDYSKPGGRKLTLSVARLRSTGPAASKGVVLVNFGGPGLQGVTAWRDHADYWAKPFDGLRREMDVVTWDTRGYPNGLSRPELGCAWQDSRMPVPPFPRNQAEMDRLASDNKARARACRTHDPELFDNMSSAVHARDMEAIRRALGAPKINLYMGSYGTWYGQSYARQFPQRVRTMVLDGGGNHADPFLREQLALARDLELRMRRFTAWCATDTSCALTGRDVPRLWRQLLRKAAKTPIPAPAVKAAYTREHLEGLLAGQLIRAGAADWPKLAKAIDQATRGDASALAPGGRIPYPSTSKFAVTECGDAPGLSDYRDLSAMVKRLRKESPNFGPGGTSLPFLLGCVGAAIPSVNPPAPLPSGVPPLLAMGTWADAPATFRSVASVPGSSTVLQPDTGHEIYVTGSACARQHADTYFTTGTLPPPNTTCTP